MTKIKRVHATLPKALHEKAKQDSKVMFGEINVSGLIKVLLANHKTKK